MILGFIIIILVIIIDQISKITMLEVLKENSITVINGFFDLHLAYNDGAGFSFFSGDFWFLILMTGIAIIIFFIIFLKINFKKAPFYSYGISLMIGGMFGNFLDRTIRPDHTVVDFLAFNIFGYQFPVFNIADSCLVIGLILFAIDLIFLMDKRKKNV